MAEKVSEVTERIGIEEEHKKESRRKMSESKAINELASAFRNLIKLEKELLESFEHPPEDDDKKNSLQHVGEKMRGKF